MGATVTNLRQWRKKRDVDVAFLERRDYSARRVGVTRRGSREIEWSLEPPQCRTVLVDGEPFRLAFPALLFGVHRMWDGEFVALHVFATLVPGSEFGLEEAPLWTMPLPNMIGPTNWVCLGDTEQDVKAGRVDPIDAFWTSAFTYHGANQVKKHLLRRWADLTQHSLEALRESGMHNGVDVDATMCDTFTDVVALHAMEHFMQVADVIPATVLWRYVRNTFLVPTCIFVVGGVVLGLVVHHMIKLMLS